MVLAALCVLVAAQSGVWTPAQRAAPDRPLPALDVPTAAPESTEPRADPLPVEPQEPPADLTWLRRVLVVAAAAVLLALLVRWGLRLRLPQRPPTPGPTGPGPPAPAPPPDPAPDLDVLHGGARAAETSLRAAVTPTDAVIAAWVALEDAAARSGVVRDRSATATEFTLRVLDRTPADPVAARTLLALYLRARFDDAPLAPDDVASAARATGVLVGTLRVGPPSEPAPRPGPAPPGGDVA